MARLARAEVFAADEIAIVHVMNRVVRRCFLMGDDAVTGKNYDYRKLWIENLLEHFAAQFGLDLLAFSILSNHFHLILRSRPDVVATWSDREVARRWRMLCPVRKNADGSPKEPSDPELKSICTDADKLAEIRSRLSDISWWMRLLCQRIAQRANAEEGQQQGKFWQNRYKAVRLLDEEAVLACAAYVDLNPTRAAIAETLESSDHTSAQRRIQSLSGSADANLGSVRNKEAEQLALPTRDAFLSPIQNDELHDELGPRPSRSDFRCSDKGFLSMSSADYLELLDWTSRRVVTGKRGHTEASLPPIFERLKIKPAVWLELVNNFGRLFSIVAGQPHRVDALRSRVRGHRYHLRKAAREILIA